MWPHDPDGFDSLVVPPADLDKDRAKYFIYLGREILAAKEAGTLRPLNADEFRWLDIEISSQHYLGQHEGDACYAIAAKRKAQPLTEGLATSDLRGWLGRVAPSIFYLAGRAQQIIAWHREHQYCGRCGTAMKDHAVDRAKHCGDCGLISYPRLSPSIIVLIEKGPQMLLARNAQWPTNMYSTLAGFVEPGESIEQTVHREIMEEVGLKVSNLRYAGSQSWPFPNSLMLGFHCDYAGGDIVCQEEEIADAQWFDANNLPNMPPKTAISRWLIDEFLERQK